VIDADRLADLLCDWCLEVRPGQQILVNTSTLAQELAVAMHRGILERGGWPLLRLAPPGVAADFYRYASDAQLDSFAPVELAELQAVDASIRIEAPANINELGRVDPALPVRAARARDPLRRARSERRWAVSIWPTPALAQQAGMSIRDYEEFLTRALFLDQPDPVAAWRALSERQTELVARLAPVREIRIESDRTDLRLGVAGRTWINSDGRRNMPSGEIFTGPLEDSANGTIYFEIPSDNRGAEVQGVELTFADGRVVAAAADHGDEHLQAALDLDQGSRLLGELGIGTNRGIDRATGSTLLDEKIAGTVHLALGRSYPETGGVNQSSLHWDLVCDLRSGGRVSVDGELLIENGTLVE
jgi:aminopeptidase